MYYIVYGLLYLVSLLPLWLLYVISDIFYGIIFYILKYRRAVVMNNLLIAFPGKSEGERLKIAKQFYRNFIDTFIETIKMISASQRFLEKRVSGNWEVINQFKDSGRSVQLHLGHNFNWEWGNAVGAKKLQLLFLGVYMPIKNKVLDRLFYKLRSRNGTHLLRATRMAEDMLQYRKAQYLLGLVADQNPGIPKSAWWFNFFGRPTPFVKGPAKNAVLNDTIVVFAFIEKPKRGYYNIVFTVAEKFPSQRTGQDLTRQFVHYLEEVVTRNPAMWLWSHRRWKHEWKEEYGPVLS